MEMVFIQFAKRDSARTPVAIFMVVCLLIIGSLNLVPFAQADESTPEKVPEPWIHEDHIFNQWGQIDSSQTQEFYINEEWRIQIGHGNGKLRISARNITQGSQDMVDYQCNIQYYINGTLYIAQFSMVNINFKIGNTSFDGALASCSDFELKRTPIVYDGAVPTFDCGIIFKGIRINTLGSSASTVDLTLTHHIMADWNDTHVKIEALLDLNNSRFYQQSGTEFSSGEPFTAEINYFMMVANPEAMRISGPLRPTRCTNTTLEYNLTVNGAPLTISKLDMKDTFTIHDGAGAHASIGYSFMEPDLESGWASVTHGFPNMTYRSTQWMKSDPEITVYHERVTQSVDPSATMTMLVTAIVVAIVAAIAITSVIIIRKRKKKKQGKDSETLKKP